MGKGPICVVVLGLLLAMGPRDARADDAPKRRYVPADVTIVPPLNIFHFRRKVIVGASVNIFYGRSAAVYGVEVGGLVNRETEGMGGIQIAGIANWVSGHCVAAQASLVNYCDRGGAIQLGLFNGGGDGLGGIQLGVLANYAESMPFAIQISPFINNVLRDFRGLQISMMNFDNQTLPKTVGSCGANCEVREITFYPEARTRGIVIGLGNLAQNMRGIQVGVMINSAARSLGGIQVGAFNYARDVKGVQIGIINVARRLRGLQIGALNIAYKNKLPVMIGLNAGF